LIDIESQSAVFLTLLFGSTDVFATNCWRWNGFSLLKGKLIMLFHDLMQHCVLNISHRHHFGGVIKLNTGMLFTGQFELVQQSQSRTSLFLHNVVDQLRVEFYFQLSECLFHFVEVVYFCFFVSSKRRLILKLLLFAQMGEVGDEAVMHENFPEHVAITKVCFNVAHSLDKISKKRGVTFDRWRSL
jgi:hypothetical protein